MVDSETETDNDELVDESGRLVEAGKKGRRYGVGGRVDRRLQQLALNALNSWEEFTNVYNSSLFVLPKNSKLIIKVVLNVNPSFSILLKIFLLKYS